MRTAIARLTLVLVLVAPGGAALGQSAPSEEAREDIRELMEVIGAGDLAMQVMSQIIGPMKEASPSVPEEFWTKFMARVDGDGIVELTIPIYAKYFTHAEVEQLLAFYRTPLGQKLIATLPAVMQESMLVGQKWAEQLAEQVLADLEAEGYE